MEKIFLNAAMERGNVMSMCRKKYIYNKFSETSTFNRYCLITIVHSTINKTEGQLIRISYRPREARVISRSLPA